MTQFYKDKLLSRYVGISLRRLVREKLNWVAKDGAYTVLHLKSLLHNLFYIQYPL
jgi:hypothetical protein